VVTLSLFRKVPHSVIAVGYVPRKLACEVDSLEQSITNILVIVAQWDVNNVNCLCLEIVSSK